MKPKLTMKHYAMIAAALVAGVLLFTECASMRIPYRRLPNHSILTHTCGL